MPRRFFAFVVSFFILFWGGLSRAFPNFTSTFIYPFEDKRDALVAVISFNNGWAMKF